MAVLMIPQCRRAQGPTWLETPRAPDHLLRLAVYARSLLRWAFRWRTSSTSSWRRALWRVRSVEHQVRDRGAEHEDSFYTAAHTGDSPLAAAVDAEMGLARQPAVSTGRCIYLPLQPTSVRFRYREARANLGRR